MSTIHNHVMVQVSVDEIKQDLPAYLQRVEAGETLVITKAGKPMAEIKPIVSIPKRLRPFGLCTGEFVVPDDFDAPLPENIVQEFEGRWNSLTIVTVDDAICEYPVPVLNRA